MPSNATFFDSATGVTINSDNAGEYTVEFLGIRPVPGDDESLLRIYRITSNATDSTGTPNAQIQSLLRICVKSDGLPCATVDAEAPPTEAP